MKRILATVFSAVLILALSIPVSADMGYMPAEKEYVCVGLYGLEYQKLGSSETRYLPLEFGTLIHVLGDMGGGMWYVEIPYPEGETTYGTISDEQLGTMFPVDEFVIPDFGQSGDTVTAKVKPAVGVELRYGPHENFKRLLTIPGDEKISYEYTFRGWCYTEYDGITGWIPLNTLETVYFDDVPTTVPGGDGGNVTSNPGSLTVTVPSETSADSDAGILPSESGRSVTSNTSPVRTSSGNSSNTLTIVIVCACAAVLTALTVLIVVLIKVRGGRSDG